MLTKGPLLMVGAPTNKNTFEVVLIRKKGVKSKHYGMSTMYVSLQRFYGALADYVKLLIEI